MTTLRYIHFLQFNAEGNRIDSFWVAASYIIDAIAAAELQSIDDQYVDWDYVADTYEQMDEYESDVSDVLIYTC